MQKSLTIFNSALYGGAVVATGIDYFVQNSAMLMWVWNKVRSVKPSDGQQQQYCWYSWAILALWPAVMIIGIVLHLNQCIV